ncbi:MAG: hypothetical protein LBK06_09645 [Planctomycetaceae bacterium]|nr:hypothetical protein [Planctomycetaceae bacterium]
MPVGTTMIGKQPSASSNSASPVSSSSSSSVSSTNLSSPNYIPAETSEITQYVPINTSYSFYDVSPFNGCGAEGSGFNPPDKIQVIYSSIVPASEKVQLFSAVIETLKKGGEEFVPVWYAPPHPNGKITEVFDLAEIACNPHDIEYGTLGFPKEKADQNFYDRMISAGAPPAIANMYYKAVKELGQSAYDEGQNRARTKANAQDHIHFFADDGSYNVGYFDDGIHGIDKSNNAKVLGGDYDVSIMKTAKERLVKPPTKWTAENYVLKGDNHQNCQDFADALIIEYNKIKDESENNKYAKAIREVLTQLRSVQTEYWNEYDGERQKRDLGIRNGDYDTVDAEIAYHNRLIKLTKKALKKSLEISLSDCPDDFKEAFLDFVQSHDDLLIKFHELSVAHFDGSNDDIIDKLGTRQEKLWPKLLKVFGKFDGICSKYGINVFEEKVYIY